MLNVGKVRVVANLLEVTARLARKVGHPHLLHLRLQCHAEGEHACHVTAPYGSARVQWPRWLPWFEEVASMPLPQPCSRMRRGLRSSTRSTVALTQCSMVERGHSLPVYDEMYADLPRHRYKVRRPTKAMGRKKAASKEAACMQAG